MLSCDAVRWTDRLFCGKYSLKGGHNITLDYCHPNFCVPFIPAITYCLLSFKTFMR